MCCGLVGVLLASFAMLATLRAGDWSLTALPRVDAKTPLGAAARRLDPGFRTVRQGAYDGQFYWAIAIDPLADGRLHTELDKPSYRYGHPLYGWFGWALSGGRVRAVPIALALIGLLSLGSAGTLGSLLGRARGGSGWEGLAVALNPGLISAVSHDLAEPLAVALLLASLTAYTRERLAVTWLLLAMLPLAKEPLVVVVVAISGWELLAGDRRRGGLLASAILPALCWWIYARIDLGAWFTSGDTALGRPLGGVWSALVSPGMDRSAPILWRIVAEVGFGVVLVLCAAGVSRAVRLRSALDLSYLALAGVVLLLAGNATAEFTTALRNTAFLAALAPLVLIASQSPPPGRRGSRAASARLSP